jgi:hypothetical protein
MGVDMRENTRMVKCKNKNWEFNEIKELLRKKELKLKTKNNFILYFYSQF